MSLGEMLREARLDARLTQEELAHRSGLSVECISLLERGLRRQPRSSTLDSLLGALPLDRHEIDAVRCAARPQPDPGRPVVRRELPPGPGTFLGRDGTTRHLATALVATDSPVVSINGLGGVGKTAQALHAAHRVADAFPGGQVFLPLRRSGRGVRTSEALAMLTSALGHEEPLPVDVERAAATWRTLSASRRMLVVLDDADGPESVRPLLPGPGNAVLVTSREQLASPYLDAQHHHLDPLPTGAAEDLLRRLAVPPGERVPPLLAVAVRCHGLPLALRIVAGHLAGRSGRAAARAARLLSARRTPLVDLAWGGVTCRPTLLAPLSGLRAGTDPIDHGAVRLAVALAARRSGAFEIGRTAATLGLTTTGAREVFERLVAVSLLEHGPTPELYRMHPLVREALRTPAPERMHG